MINIEKAFVTENRSVFEFFQQPGLGFYIPLYQREYSWDADNIEQLLDDISKGIERLAQGGNDDDEIRFLGTIITVAESNKNNVQPQDTQALPARIDKLIDGQQRLSTIAIFATLLHRYLQITLDKIKANDPLREEVEEIVNSWIGKLVVIYSLDLQRGKPKLKPKIIRGQKDKWTRDGDIESNYTSSIAHYLAKFISREGNELPDLDKNILGEYFADSVKKIDRWLRFEILEAHIRNNDNFLPAWDILNRLNQFYIWFYDRPNLKTLVDSRNINKKSVDYVICELVQLFSVCHYLTERCCFTIIQPSNDDWAFDMFQSLNATGTPLTAIETFKPIVVSITEQQEGSFKESRNANSFTKIEKLFQKTVNAAQKSKLTNDFLTSFAIAYDGSKLSSHFSHQRKQLEKYFEKNTTYIEKQDFLKFIGDYAEFYRVGWNEFDGKQLKTLPLIADVPDTELASLLFLFLKASSHKMALTIMGYFYKDVINGSSNSIQNFVSTIKAIAAFYSIWRAAAPNAGLDNVYREFFKDDDEPANKSWRHRRSIQVSEVKEHLIRHLFRKFEVNNIGELKSYWLNKAPSELKYNNVSTLCRLALFIASHDTMPDQNQPGVMKISVPNSSNFLTVDNWTSEKLSTIEHIAPIKNDNNWDSELYNPDTETVHSIGNLTLLPPAINTSASNKGWREKHLYYRHLSERDPVVLQELANRAVATGIVLGKETIEKLQSSNYREYMSSIVTLPEGEAWDASIVRRRTERIIEIFWQRISPWLFD